MRVILALVSMSFIFLSGKENNTPEKYGHWDQYSAYFKRAECKDCLPAEDADVLPEVRNGAYLDRSVVQSLPHCLLTAPKSAKGCTLTVQSFCFVFVSRSAPAYREISKSDSLSKGMVNQIMSAHQDDFIFITNIVCKCKETGKEFMLPPISIGGPLREN